MMKLDPRDRRALIAIGCIVLIYLLLYAVAPSDMRTTAQPNQSPRRTDDDVDACVMARVFVKQQLRAPATAEFPVCSPPDVIATQTGDTWTVISYVDAQNGFGATLRTNYVAVMRHHAGTDQWALLDLDLTTR